MEMDLTSKYFIQQNQPAGGVAHRLKETKADRAIPASSNRIEVPFAQLPLLSSFFFRIGMVLLLEAQACVLVMSPFNKDYTSNYLYPSICHEMDKNIGAENVTISSASAYIRDGLYIQSCPLTCF